MAALEAAPQQPVSAQVVGNAFVQQYYHILHQSPGLVHRFYQDISKLGRPEDDGTMSVTTTMDAINSKIISLNYDELRAEIKSVDAQESLNGGVSVLVTGFLTGKDNVLQKFTQSFFLAPQDKGYFVLNDMFRYIEETTQNEGISAPVEDVEATINPEQVAKSFPVVEDNIPEEVSVPTEEPEAEVFNPPEKVEVAVVDKEEEKSVAVDVDEVQEVSQLVVESNTKIEEVPKKSYASIVLALKQNGVPFSSPPPASRKQQPRIQEQPVNNVQPTALAVETVSSNVDSVENGIHEEEANGYSIYIKGLPMSATPVMLDEEFKKFGTIKPNGIQVRSNRGFCFGFVEFETPEAVQKAIEASPVLLGGRNAVVEEKRSTNSRGARGRYPIARGPGFRNDGIRGRGNFSSGRGFNRPSDFNGVRGDFGGGRGDFNGGRGDFGGGRGDFNGGGRGDFGGGRSDYGGNRGGGRGGMPPARGGNGGGDGYQRERMNRNMGVNGAAKNMAPRVPATA